MLESSLFPFLFCLCLNCTSHAKSGFSEEHLDCQNCCLESVAQVQTSLKLKMSKNQCEAVLDYDFRDRL